MLRNKIALVTGSTRGLGLSIAKFLSEIGCTVILTGRNKENLELAYHQLNHKANHIILCGDLLEASTRKNLFELPVMPEIIIHNLGGKVEGDRQPLDFDIMSKSINFNLGVATSLNAHYLPIMMKTAFGRIIHISSDVGETGRCAPALAASKAAINAYVKSTARFYAKYNVMLCAVLPGIFLHPSSVWNKKQKTEPVHYDNRLDEMPLGRFISIEEVAEVVTNIANSDNMAYSGSLIKLTGAH